MKRYLVAYDVADKSRLTKVRKIAYAYAMSGQKSAVEAPLGSKHLQELFSRLVEVLDEEEDKLNIIAFAGEPIVLGKGDYIDEEEGLWVV